MAGKCMILFATDRSGHHAFLEWMCHQGRPALYFNSCHTKNGKIVILKNGKFFPQGNEGQQNGGTDTNKEPNKRLDLIKKKGFLAFNAPLELSGKKKYRNPNKVVHENWYFTHRLYSVEDTIYTVLLRDIYNLVASQSQVWGGELRRRFKITKREWVDNVKVALGDTKVPDDINFKHVSYNRWFEDKEYRKSVSKTFGFKFDDLYITRPAKAFTGTTSFASKKNAQELEVLDRWKQVKEFPWDLITDEMHELNERYFGFSIRDGEMTCVGT